MSSVSLQLSIWPSFAWTFSFSVSIFSFKALISSSCCVSVSPDFVPSWFFSSSCAVNVFTCSCDFCKFCFSCFTALTAFLNSSSLFCSFSETPFKLSLTASNSFFCCSKLADNSLIWFSLSSKFLFKFSIVEAIVSFSLFKLSKLAFVCSTDLFIFSFSKSKSVFSSKSSFSLATWASLSAVNSAFSCSNSLVLVWSSLNASVSSLPFSSKDVLRVLYSYKNKIVIVNTVINCSLEHYPSLSP